MKIEVLINILYGPYFVVELPISRFSIQKDDFLTNTVKTSDNNLEMYSSVKCHVRVFFFFSQSGNQISHSK